VASAYPLWLCVVVWWCAGVLACCWSQRFARFDGWRGPHLNGWPQFGGCFGVFVWSVALRLPCVGVWGYGKARRISPTGFGLGVGVFG